MKLTIKLVSLFALSDTITELSCGEKLGFASGNGERATDASTRRIMSSQLTTTKTRGPRFPT
jgi:hypothetical protein